MKSYEDAVMAMLGAYFKKHDTAHLQKHSYDLFLTHRLTKIIEEEPQIEVMLKKNEFYRVEFGQIFVDRPYIVDEKRSIQYILPNEALLRDLTYSSPLSVNIFTKHYTVSEEDGTETILEEKTHVKIPIARIPIMVGCSKCNLSRLSESGKVRDGHCENDPGGYFIIKGKERVLVAQERTNYNTVYIFEKKSTDQKHVMVSEIRSMSEETGHSVLIQMKICANNHRIMVTLPFITQDVPLGFVFAAYGCDIQTIDAILRKNIGVDTPEMNRMIQTVIKDAMIIQTEENAIHHIAQFATHIISRERRVMYVKQILMSEVFPHLGISSGDMHKILFLGHMCGKLLLTFGGYRSMDDRDHLTNKRVEVAGVLVGDLFRTLWKRFIRTITPQLMKRLDILIIISKLNIITMGLRHCFSTGNWGIPKSNYIRTGVSQVLSRMSYNSTLSHLRRIVIPIGKEGRNTKIRQVHPTQIGFICSSETPEGSSAGIVKNFSLISEVSAGVDPIFMRMILEKLPGIETDFDTFLHRDRWIKVFLNGNWMGLVPDGEDAYCRLDYLKNHQRLIPMQVSFMLEDNELRIYCDEGRMIRPFFVAGRMPSIEDLRNKDWDTMVREGRIVWMDSHELENKVVAMYPRDLTDQHDLCEIHPCLMLGICASLMPFADHTQSPRICYHSSMVKQSIGIYCGTNEIRADTVAHLLSYPEKPVVRTHVEEWLNLDKLPCGNNVIVAIACYGGWNQEDSIILNRSSVDRGLFRSFTYRTLMVEEKKKTSSHIEAIDMPPLESRIRSFNYSKLDTQGIVRPGLYVGSGDVIVAKTSVRQVKMGREEKMDTSVVIKNGEEGFVDKVFITTTPDGYKMVKIKIRAIKIPEVGDKLCSNCAQKGTIGMTLPREDMPFTPDGIVPDIIINPLCIPSRMTINQLMESIGAKSAVLQGKFRHATTFSEHSVDIVESLKQELHDTGYERNGNERMINGITGELMEAEIFIGPCYYHRLKHLVSAKIHARNHGKVSQLTHQPLEGRSRDGGLRFGEMERDAMISHGNSRFLLERLFDMSDPFRIPICSQCGAMPSSNSYCAVCEGTDVVTVPMPYACKLLFQELNAMGIRINLFPEKDCTASSSLLHHLKENTV
jgi:DNA-directed RNA polymerase II subunit RPB2